MRPSVLLFVACLLRCSRQPDLAERVRQRLLVALPGASVRIVDPSTIRIESSNPGDKEWTLSLDNLRLQCAKGVQACVDAIASTVASMVDTRRNTVEALEAPLLTDVRLTLKDPEWIAQMEKAFGKGPAEKRSDRQLLKEPFAGDLSIVYVLDMPKSMRMLVLGDLEKLKVDREELRQVARANLRAAFPEVPMEEIRGTGVWTNTRRDDYDSACLVLVDIWKPFAEKLKGRLIVSVPARNRIFAVGPGTRAQIDALRKVTEATLREEHHPLSNVLLEWSPSRWRSDYPR